MSYISKLGKLEEFIKDEAREDDLKKIAKVMPSSIVHPKQSKKVMNYDEKMALILNFIKNDASSKDINKISIVSSLVRQKKYRKPNVKIM